MPALEAINSLKKNIANDIIGQEAVIESLIIGLLANGNLLLEGLPGLAKTRAIKSLAKNINSDFGRIQFTPDLLPSDITGAEIYYNDEGKGEFKFNPGPIFANIVLADEINRAPAKVQAALLEAMEERQVTVAGTTHKLPALFMVMATQNPIEQEGTYPLPEAQKDRFLMHINIGYSNKAEESLIISLVRGERSSDEKQHEPGAVTDQATIFEARKEIEQVTISDDLQRYLVDLVFATREPENYSKELSHWIEIGASPRASLALDICSRTHAWLQGQDYVSPENVVVIAKNVFRHRLTLSYEASAEGVSADAVIAEILKLVAVP